MAQRKILIVDDDAPTRSLLQALLGHNGYTCTEAATGTEALDLIRSGQYDAIVLDLLLPDVDGFEILRDLKSAHSALVPRTMVLTAAAERIYETRNELNGVWCVLKKPVDIGELCEQIDECVEQRRVDRKPPGRVDGFQAMTRKQTG